MRRLQKIYLLSVFILAVISVLFILVYIWNREFLHGSALLLFLPALLIIFALYILFRQTWREINRIEKTNEEKGSGSDNMATLKTDKAVSKKESINIEGIARKINRNFDPAATPADQGKDLLKILSSEIEIMSGLFYSLDEDGTFFPAASFAYSLPNAPENISPGDGINGQAIQNKHVMIISELPEDYFKVYSGLGAAKPSYLALIPLLEDNKVVALIECTGFREAGIEMVQLFNLISATLSEKISGNKKTDK